MSRQWILASQSGFETSLQYQDNIPIPPPDSLRSNEVLVKIHETSLTYREIQIADPNVSKLPSRIQGVAHHTEHMDKTSAAASRHP